MWGANMMGWSGGAGMYGVGHLLWLVLLVVAILVLVRWISGGVECNRRTEEDRSRAILRERYARGDIDKAEFDTRERDLEWNAGHR